MSRSLRVAAAAAIGIGVMFPISTSVAHAAPCDNQTGKDSFGRPGLSLECDTCIEHAVLQHMNQAVCGGVAAGINPGRDPAIAGACALGGPCVDPPPQALPPQPSWTTHVLPPMMNP
jgi:hypothetical protein